jgi:uncharacterized protein with PQ loop repeat
VLTLALPKETSITVLPADGAASPWPRPPVPSWLEKFLRALSVVTMLMTVPQVFAIWVGHSAQGVSLLSWAAYLFSACLWFVYGIRKGDKTIYLACVGWILLDAAIVVGVVVYG